MDKSWHNLGAEEVLHKLKSSRSGLIEAEAADRLRQYGHNELKGKKKTPPITVFLRQFLSPLIYILLVAVVISAVLREFLDAGVIAGVLLLNATIGFIQETRAEKAMEALMRMAAPKARVRRDGKMALIPAREIVPGDIFLLEAGDRVPADARLIEASNLQVNEAMLTGESMPVDKHSTVLSGEIAVAERKNLVYSSTVVTYGRATAVVVQTGMNTEIGKIAAAIQEIEPEPTPLQKSIGKLSRYIVILFLSIVVILIIVGVLKGLGLLDMFLLAVAAAVSAIPEGLPAVVTVVLAIGMRAMARRNAIIRKLVAVETLGAATVICSDKTGTLTMNEMTVQRLFADGEMIEVTGEGYEPKGEFRRRGQGISPEKEPTLNLLLTIGALCNDATLICEGGTCNIFGDPTEGALVVAAVKAGLSKEKLESAYPRFSEIPFQSEKQYMATLHSRDGSKVAYVKGAVERLLGQTGFVLRGGQAVPITQDDIQTFMAANQEIAQEAMRVIALAYVELHHSHEGLREEDIRGKLVLVGLVGMADPPREEVKEAVRLCREAGIRVVMVTGDHKVTAEAIGRELDLPKGEAVTGAELAKMSDEELRKEIENISVFARIEPLHKLRIVNALKTHGEVVAMTGDGVNDAPALKAANIGIAMGITGTDVAKEAADMVLADDNFASVVAAVEEGRAIFNRLRNNIFFLLSTNLGELIALTLSVMFIGQVPMLPVQIIWNNLATDTAVDVPLGLEPKIGNELKQPPRHPRVGLLFPGMLFRILFMATLMGVGIFVVFNWALGARGIEEARTVTFCTMVTFEWFRAFNARSDELTAFRMGIFRNRWLIISISVAILLQMAVVYVPFLQAAFQTVPLDWEEWRIILIAGGALFTIEELRKVFFPRLFSWGKWRPVREESKYEV